MQIITNYYANNRLIFHLSHKKGCPFEQLFFYEQRNSFLMRISELANKLIFFVIFDTSAYLLHYFFPFYNRIIKTQKSVFDCFSKLL
jgi:hypothetical protein